MANVNIAVQQISRSGLAATYTTGLTASDNYYVPNDGEVFLHFSNGATEATVTLVTPNTVDGLAIADRTLTVPANHARFFGPFPPSDYNDSNRMIHLTFATPTTLTVAALRV